MKLRTWASGLVGVSVGEDGIVIIDDRFAPLTPKIQAALAALSPKLVRLRKGFLKPEQVVQMVYTDLKRSLQ